MTPLDEAMAEMESQFAQDSVSSHNDQLDMDLLSRAKAMCVAATELSSSTSPNKSTPTKINSPIAKQDIDLDMGLLSRAKAMCAAATELSSSTSPNKSTPTKINSPITTHDIELDMALLSRAKAMCVAATESSSSTSPNKSTPTKINSPIAKQDIELDMDLLTRAKAMCAAVNKGPRSPYVSKRTPPKSHSRSSATATKSPTPTSSSKIDDPMDHSLLARAKAMCAAANTLSGNDDDNELPSAVSTIVDEPNRAPVIDGWRALPCTVAVFTGSSLVTTKNDVRQRLKPGTKVLIANKVYEVASKKEITDKSFELTEDFTEESNLEAYVYKPSQLKSSSSSAVKKHSLVMNEAEKEHSLTSIPSSARAKPSNQIVATHQKLKFSETSDAQKRALDRLRKHKQQEAPKIVEKEEEEDDTEGQDTHPM